MIGLVSANFSILGEEIESHIQRIFRAGSIRFCVPRGFDSGCDGDQHESQLDSDQRPVRGARFDLRASCLQHGAADRWLEFVRVEGEVRKKIKLKF